MKTLTMHDFFVRISSSTPCENPRRNLKQAKTDKTDIFPYMFENSRNFCKSSCSLKWKERTS